MYHHVSIAWAWWIAIRNWPGGDSYFGALLNSLIHVMMYSYYTLSLLKVRCPWKRYLTQAQLLQFTTVLFYTAFLFYIHCYKRQDAELKHFVCISVQSFEMISMFVLFMHFYSKTYKKKTGRKKSSSESDNGSEVPEQVSISSDSSNSTKKNS